MISYIKSKISGSKNISPSVLLTIFSVAGLFISSLAHNLTFALTGIEEAIFFTLASIFIVSSYITLLSASILIAGKERKYDLLILGILGCIGFLGFVLDSEYYSFFLLFTFSLLFYLRSKEQVIFLFVIILLINVASFHDILVKEPSLRGEWYVIILSIPVICYFTRRLLAKN